MPDLIFWDTSAFVALGSPRDQLHEKARVVREQLIRQQTQMLTTEAVLLEVGNAFSRRELKPVAIRWIMAIQNSVSRAEAVVVSIEHALWLRGWGLFQHRQDKDWGLIDCISFVIMQDHSISTAFTADHHFAQAGFTCLL